MTKTIRLNELYSNDELFAQGVQAGELTFVAQDARGRSEKVVENCTANDQSRTLENLSLAFKSVGLSLENIISLTVFLPDYSDAKQVAEVLRSTFGESGKFYPVTTLVGVCGLEANCRIRMDAIATSSGDRKPIVIRDLPFAWEVAPTEFASTGLFSCPVSTQWTIGAKLVSRLRFTLRC